MPLHSPVKEKEEQLDLKKDHVFKIQFEEADFCKFWFMVWKEVLVNWGKSTNSSLDTGYPLLVQFLDEFGYQEFEENNEKLLNRNHVHHFQI